MLSPPQKVVEKVVLSPLPFSKPFYYSYYTMKLQFYLSVLAHFESLKSLCGPSIQGAVQNGNCRVKIVISCPFPIGLDFSLNMSGPKMWFLGKTLNSTLIASVGNIVRNRLYYAGPLSSGDRHKTTLCLFPLCQWVWFSYKSASNCLEEFGLPSV